MESMCAGTDDRKQIRLSLRKDSIWAAYPLADLDPQFHSYCSWYVSGDVSALVFRRFDTPILWASGGGPQLASILKHIGDEPALDLQVREEALPVLARQYRWGALRTMLRMSVQPTEFRPKPGPGAQRLRADSLRDVQDLYADGLEDGTAPDYFFAEMLDEGVFFGVRESGVLVSAAGTHVLSREEGVAALGNVYTRRDSRGRGYGGEATSAVVAALFEMGIEIVVLNVKIGNVGAARVYESLGFRTHCSFHEGLAVRRHDLTPDNPRG